MLEIQDLLYQLRLSEQASTQLFEKRLGISLTRYQMLLFCLRILLVIKWRFRSV